MLRLIDKAPDRALNATLEAHPELSVRIGALWQAYGPGRNFFNVWLQDGDRACLARLDDVFFLVDGTVDINGGTDWEEIASMLRMSPEFSCLLTTETAARRVAERLGSPVSVGTRRLLRMDTLPRGPRPAGVTIDRRPDLRSVYRVAASFFPMPGGFIAWYTDMSHRLRHGCARAYALWTDGAPASVCLVSAQSGQAGLISSVTTLPACRGRGFASALLHAACADLLQSGRTPILECRPELLTFYRERGFREFCPMAELRPL